MKSILRSCFLAAFAAAAMSAPAVHAAEGDLLERVELDVPGYMVTDPGILAGLPAGVTVAEIPKGSSLAIPIPSELKDKPGHPYTLAMKIKTRIENDWVCLLNMPDSNDTDAMIYLDKTTRKVCIKQFNKSRTSAVSDCGVELDRWTVLAFVFGENFTEIFLDGNPVFMENGGSLAGSYADCYSAGSDFLIGADDSGDDNPFYIADIRIYDGAVAVGDELPGYGATDAPFRIASAADWELFADNVNLGRSPGLSVPVYRLDNDIGTASAPVTQSVGEDGASFHGIFDGNSHTLHVAISGDAPGTAPFGRTDRAIIGNLTVAGSVFSTADHAAGLVGIAGDNTIITNCTVSASVTVSGAGYAGGIVGYAGNGITAALEGDVFSGSVSGPSAHAGGLIGWCDSLEALALRRCLSKGSFSGSGKWHPIACMNAGSTISREEIGTALYYLNTAMPTEDAEHVIPGAEGRAVSESPVTGWTLGVEAADGRVYYLKGFAIDSTTGAKAVADGALVTGTGGTETCLVVQDGATVTLHDVDITAIPDDNDHDWPAVLCQGDATIVLEGINSLKGGNALLPAIYVYPGKTLVIRGNGALAARSNGQAPGIGAWQGTNGACGNIVIEGGTIIATGGQYAAGIGCSLQGACGEITISGGTVIATGGQYAAGIGGSYQADCGTIAISGGTVTATSGEFAAAIGSGPEGNCSGIAISGGTVTAAGGLKAPGIGAASSGGTCGNISITGGTVQATGAEASAGIGCGGGKSQCGDISISEDVDRVTAAHGENGDASVGAGQNSTCGTVTVGGTETGPIADNPWTYAPHIVEIATVADWDAFASRVNGGVDSCADKTVVLAADIGPVATPAGTQDHPFRGTFDGGGHVLTAALSGTDTFVAPFSAIGGATIANLVVDGRVSGAMHCSGLVGAVVDGTNLIENCKVAAAISSSGSHFGGFVGHSFTNAVTMRGCVFSGSLSGGTYVATFHGWSDDGAETALVDCFDASASAQPIGRGHDAVCVSNTYYLASKNFGNAERLWSEGNRGKRAWPVTAGACVTIDFGVPAATYGVSGIAAYAPGMDCDGGFYAGAGDAVPLVLSSTPPVDAFSASAGTLTRRGSGWTLSMPDGPVVVYVQGGRQPQGALDVCEGRKNAVHVTGWAYDPDISSLSIDVEVRLYTDADCTSQYGDAHAIKADEPRADVNQVKGVEGDHGFDADIPVPIEGDCDYWVKVFALDATGDANPLLAAARRVTVLGNALPRGSLDACTGGMGFVRVQGWAYDPDTPSQSIGVRVHLYTDADCTSQYGDAHALAADAPSPDANAAQGITGDHGFDADLPAAAGDYWVRAFAIDTEGGSDSPLCSATAVAVKPLPDGETMVTASTTEMATGTYRVTANVTVESRIFIHGDVTLVLDEGKTLTAPKGIDVAEGNALTIEGSGALNATAEMHHAAIGGGDSDGGTIHIHGGTITATGGRDGAGIGSGYSRACGDIAISGGTVVARGGDWGAGIGSGDWGTGGTIAISGGTVVASGGKWGAGIGGGSAGECGTINISGGQVSANSGGYGSGIGPGDQPETGATGTVTLGWTSEDDFIYASNYDNVETLAFADGKQFYFAEGGTNHIATPDNMAGKKLMPYVSSNLAYANFVGIKAQYLYTGNGIDIEYEVCLADGQKLAQGTHYTANFSAPAIKEVGEYTLAIAAVDGSGYTGSKSFVFSVVLFDMNDAVVTGFKPFCHYHYTGESIDVTYSVAGFEGNPLMEGRDYTAEFSPSTIRDKGDYTLILTAESIGYTGSKTIHFTVGDGIPVTSDMTALNDNWYLVSEDVTIDRRLAINGDVTLVLVEGKTLNASQGINLSQGNKLTITGKGTLNADASNWDAGIGTDYGDHAFGTLVIEDGIINAHGGYHSAGIGGGRGGKGGGMVTINGGTVTATGGYNAAGIGGGSAGEDDSGMCGTIIVNGGKVTANGGDGAAGMGAMDGAPVGGSITLGWTGEDDFIHASSYGNVASVRFADGKYFYWRENGINQAAIPDNIDGKTLLPLVSASPRDMAYLYVPGVAPYYFYDGNEVDMDYRVIDFDGNELVEGTHFTAAFSQLPIKEKGDYTLTLTAMEGSGFAGTKVIPFSVRGPFPVTSETTVMNVRWYEVSNEVTIDGRIAISGDVTLILDEGKTLTASKGIELSAGNTLTIEGKGKLVATGEDSKAGIGAKTVGTLVVNGGIVQARGGNNAAGIGGSNNNYSGGAIIINAGEVRAEGGFAAAAIGGGNLGTCGTITINGGKVHAERFPRGSHSTAIGPGFHLESANHKSGTVTLGWTTADDAILATRYGMDSYGEVETLRVADGKALFCAATGKFYAGTLDGAQMAEIAGKTLTPALVLADGADNAAAVAADDGMTLAVQLAGRTFAKNGSWQTLCVPFDMTAEQVAAQLAPSALATLRSSSFEDGALALDFADADAIEAGKPYIVRWDGGDDLVSPVFTNVAVRNAAAPVETQYADFIGSFSSVEIAAANAAVRLVGADGMPVRPDADTTLGACRAWLRLKDEVAYGLWAAQNGISGAWDAVDAEGVANVFRYLFGKPEGTDGLGILGIRWDDGGRPVVVTSPLANASGFDCALESAGTLSWTDTSAIPLSPSGETPLETSAPILFFRLTATPAE